MTELLGPDDIEPAVAALERGELVAFPTETVYGLGADATSAAALARIFEAKGRPRGHPLIVHLAHPADLERVGSEVGHEARALADAFWPGPLTVIVGRGPAVAPEATGGRATVGLRVPDHPVALALLAAFGRGVAAPSANRFGSVSPTTAAHVVEDLGHRVDRVIDGGRCRVGVESTIVDTTGPTPVLLRPGGISSVEIEAVLGRPLSDGRSGPSRAPGMLVSHYAPSVPVELVDQGQLETVLAGASGGGQGGGEARGGIDGRSGIGVVAPFAGAGPHWWTLPDDAAGYGARLYATLREADRAGLRRLLVAPPTTGALREAVLDRLQKAAAPRGASGLTGPRRSAS